ncbi:Pentatricopeptide repeat-containing protein [Hibiscus syriacus]|uniref:Pentatricopeptide repeat-containing protein n=1 Tax=Hibiscus syriacus TaxID=106335 RepID=A0A6A2ZF68_HIBSY|nr:Pentatricopeptide repeat-containing protein [Hibiscus syriacus]
MTSSRYSSFFSELIQCTKQRNLLRGLTLHARIVKAGSFSCVYLSNSLVNLYAKCGDLLLAKLVFDNIQHRDVVSWNCIINGYSQQGSTGSSFVMELFQRMRAENVLPNSHTFAGVFTAASNFSDVFSGMQAHALSIKTDNFCDVFVGSSLLNMYCKSGDLVEARKVFDEMPERNSVSWATMISGYAMQRSAVEAFELFKLMRLKDEKVNEYALSSVLSALADPVLLSTGRQIHCLTVKNGLLVFVSVGNALVTMHAKCGSLDDALKAFELSGDKNSITWSAIITGYSQSGESLKALKLFSNMHFAGITPSKYTLVGVLNACSDVPAVEEGKQVHGYLLKLGYESQIWFLWTSMIGGYVQNGENENAMNLYGRMRIEGIIPNELTLASILKACSCLAALEQGKQIHACTIKHGFGLEVPIGSALSTMYAKCGSLENGSLVFRKMPWRDIVSWNAMISGLAQNGHGNEALKLFDEMLLEGTEPDYVTFVNLLSACSHMGLVEKGWDYFNMMSDKFRIVPRVEHYACMVDILGRAGKLDEAKEFIESATIDHGMCLWRILLSACRNFRNYELGAYAGEKLMELGSQESSAYVLLSSIYIALGRLEDVERVRRLMRLRGVSKEPGCSWIELKDGVHVFVVGDQMHPEIKAVREELLILSKQLKDEGYHYQPFSDSVSENTYKDEELIAAFM